MPIKKGETNIGAIYKGTTEIACIYKGATLVYENTKFLDVLFNNVYYSLIDNANVKNQGKAKLGTIYGNGVIENQLVNESPDEQTLTSNNSTLQEHVFTGFTAIVNHKYLIKIKSKLDAIPQTHDVYRLRFYFDGQTSTNLPQSTSYSETVVFKTATSASTLALQIRNDGKCYFKECNVFDLTLMFGTGNEPTSTSDNRIQSLLNRGYIEYNAGSYRASKVGEIEFEPYNLCDNDFESGFIINNGSDLSISYCVRTPHTRPIEVLPNVSYTFSVNSAQYKYVYIVEYDENMGFIKQNGGTNNTSTTATMSANTKYIRLVYGDKDNTPITTIPNASVSQPCLFRTGTRTGYSPYLAPTQITLPNTLELGGAINAHNTFEVGATGYIFTRNVWKVDLETLNWNYLSNYKLWLGGLSTIKSFEVSKMPNICCANYITNTYNNALFNNMYCIGVSNQNLGVYKDSADDGTTQPSGILYYELATPQVIRIPKKHLGCVDLGTLTWNTANANGYTYSNSVSNLKAGVSGVVANIYANKYLSDTSAHVAGETQNTIGVNANKTLLLCDRNLASMTNAQIQAKLSGQYLFYETESEVADFTNKATFEKGGTITTDSDVLPNLLLQLQK